MVEERLKKNQELVCNCKCWNNSINLKCWLKPNLLKHCPILVNVSWGTMNKTGSLGIYVGTEITSPSKPSLCLTGVCNLFFPDHFRFCLGPHAKLHCPGPLVCYLPPTVVQEHSQEGLQEHCGYLGCVVCHHDPSSYCDGVQQPAAWAHKQNQPVHSVWWTLGR